MNTTKPLQVSKPHFYQYDILRFVACFMVVAVHAGALLDSSWGWSSAYHTFYNALFLCANGLFFLMSGHFNIKCKDDAQLPSYYFSKVKNLLVPALVYMFVQSLYEMYLMPEASTPGFLGFIKYYIKMLWSVYGSSHYWFIMMLFGFLLATPFFAEFLVRLGKNGKRFFFALGALWICLNYLSSNLALEISWSYPFGTFLWMYCLGYFLTDAYIADVWKRFRAVICVSILVCFLLIPATIFAGWSVHAFDTSPFYVALSILLYIAILGTSMNRLNLPEGGQKKPPRLVSFVAARSYGIYMIHMVFISYLMFFVAPFPGKLTMLSPWLLAFAVFVLSILASWILDISLVRLAQQALEQLRKAFNALRFKFVLTETPNKD